jgi:hypothetical protein
MFSWFKGKEQYEEVLRKVNNSMRLEYDSFLSEKDREISFLRRREDLFLEDLKTMKRCIASYQENNALLVLQVNIKSLIGDVKDLLDKACVSTDEEKFVDNELVRSVGELTTVVKNIEELLKGIQDKSNQEETKEQMEKKDA